MTREHEHPPTVRARVRHALGRLISIADLPGDDDDTRLRKRVGVAAGYVTIVARFGAAVGAASLPLIGAVIALGLSLWSVGNVVVLARTKRFERFVVAQIAVGAPFTFFTTILIGGVTHSSGSFAWAFLVPAYALLALGPRRATRWFYVFVGALILAVAVDPTVSGWFAPPPYPIQLFFYIQNIGAPLTITFLLLRYVDIRRRAAEARSDELLTNAIPASIATRLRHGESTIAEAYPATTVVFVDVVGFTPWANRTEPERVVSLLDDLFTRLDGVAAEHGVEKIKTVGDAYMAVVGAPEARDDHAPAAIGFGRAVLEEVAAWRRANDLELEVRIGMASGPVVGGVIGRRRILFDLWGGTVNLAARMESSGLPGRIQVTESTHALVDGSHPFEERQVDIKGLGAMTTYLLEA
jgi:adenylate cyclase